MSLVIVNVVVDVVVDVIVDVPQLFSCDSNLASQMLVYFLITVITFHSRNNYKQWTVDITERLKVIVVTNIK